MTERAKQCLIRAIEYNLRLRFAMEPAKSSRIAGNLCPNVGPLTLRDIEFPAISPYPKDATSLSAAFAVG